MSTLRLKIKGILTLPSKEFEEKKPCQNFCTFGPNLHCFFKEFFHLQIVIINNARIFFHLFIFSYFFFGEPYFIINFYEGKNHPSSILLLAPLFNLANNYASIDQ